MGYKYGQMVASMKGFGLKIRHQGLEDLYLLMVTFMKVNGRMIKLMGKEIITMQKVQLTKVDGSKTNKKVTVKKNGLMAVIISEAIFVGKSMVQVLSCGLTGPNTKENGETTKCMAKENSNGAMEESIKVITIMTKSMGKESISGQMVDSIPVGSIMGNNTAKESINKQMEQKFTACGTKAKRISYAKIGKSIYYLKTPFDLYFRLIKFHSILP